MNSIIAEMNWLNGVVSNAESEEHEDIIEKFTLMSNINLNMNTKTNREEIRRRLAMGYDSNEYLNGEKMNKKPSLQTRLQSGMNLQICFMNENTSDTDSINSEFELEIKAAIHPTSVYKDESLIQRPDSLHKCFIDELPFNRFKPCISKSLLMKNDHFKQIIKNQSDFLKIQAQLQTEAKLALVQAKEMAHMQMELEKQRHETSPITEMIEKSLEKVGISFPIKRRRLNRQILTEMNIAQLQIIANDLHSKIEKLNENLVRSLMGRDDLHMEQDSILVDIEDLTQYLDANKCGT